MFCTFGDIGGSKAGSPHLAVQVNKVPLEVMRKNISLQEAAEEEGRTESGKSEAMFGQDGPRWTEEDRGREGKRESEAHFTRNEELIQREGGECDDH